MSCASPQARVWSTAALLCLCLGPLAGTAAAERGPYVVGEEDKPVDGVGEPEVVHADILLLATHRYSDRFAVERLTISPTGREVAAITRASREGPMAWDVGTGRPLQLPPMPPATTTVAYNFGMTRVAAALRGDALTQRAEGTIALFNLETGQMERELPGADGVRNLAFSPSDRLLVAAVADGVRLWDLDQRRPEPRTLVRMKQGADWVSFSRDNEVRVAAEGGNVLLQVSTRDGGVLESWNSRDPEGPVCLSPGGRYVARAQGSAIELHDLAPEGQAGGQQIKVQGEISSLSWAASGRVLAAGTTDGEIFVFSVRGVEALEPIEPPAGSRPAQAARARPQATSKKLQDNPGWIERSPRRASGSARSDRSEGARRDKKEPEYEIRADVRTLILEQMDGDPRTSQRLERALLTNLNRLEPCWKRALRHRQSTDGQLVLDLTISPDGEGRAFEDPVKDSIQNPELTDCLLGKLRSPLFGPGLGSLEVQLTLTLDKVEVD